MTGVQTFAWVYWVVGLLVLSVAVVSAFGDGPDTSPTFVKRAGITWLVLMVVHGAVHLL